MKADDFPISINTLTGISALALMVMSFFFKDHPEYLLSWVFFATVLILFLIVHKIKLNEAERSQEVLAEANRILLKRMKVIDEAKRTLECKVEERAKSLMSLQTQLLQAEKFSAIGQLAAGVAHEINNPVGFINSNLQTLRQYVVHYTKLLGILNKLEKALKDKDQQRAAEVVASWEKIRSETNFGFIGGDIDNLLKESVQGVEKIGKIISDLRTLASPDRGKMVSVNIETLMDSMLNIVHNEIKYKAELVLEYGNVPCIICNPQKIGQVFVNILMNAAQAIEAQGKITVRTYTRDELVCVDITDTGCGIAPDNFTKIFDPLFTTKPPGKGMGLGLSLSYDVVRKHKGSISFKSKLGEGTTFTVLMPMGVAEYDASQIWRVYERD